MSVRCTRLTGNEHLSIKVWTYIVFHDQGSMHAARLFRIRQGSFNTETHKETHPDIKKNKTKKTKTKTKKTHSLPEFESNKLLHCKMSGVAHLREHLPNVAT